MYICSDTICAYHVTSHTHMHTICKRVQHTHPCTATKTVYMCATRTHVHVFSCKHTCVQQAHRYPLRHTAHSLVLSHAPGAESPVPLHTRPHRSRLSTHGGSRGSQEERAGPREPRHMAPWMPALGHSRPTAVV